MFVHGDGHETEIGTAVVEDDVFFDDEVVDAEWAGFEAALGVGRDVRSEVREAWCRAELDLIRVCDAIVELDRAGAFALDGASSAEAWVRYRFSVPLGKARRLVRRARGFARFPGLRDAASTFVLSTDQIDVLLEVFTPARAEYADRDLAVLIDRVRVLSIRQCMIVAGHWAARVDAEVEAAIVAEGGPIPAPNPTVSELRIAPILDGDVVLDGHFEKSDGQMLQAAIAAAHRLSKPAVSERDDESLEDGTVATKVESERDDRTAAQQRADALVLIAKFFLDHHESVTGTSIGRPHVNVTVDLDRLTSAHLTGDPDQPYSTSNIDLAAILQDACDCSVTRILTAGPSIVLDIGRESRVIPVALRKAIIHRDKTCRHPGCDMPAWFGDVHHIRHWTNGGETTRENCVLLCRRHHTAIHKRGWTVTGNPNGDLWFTNPIGERQRSRPPNLAPPLPLTG